MKSLLENFAVLLVGLLSLALVYLIVQYNLIKDTTLDEIIEAVPQPKVSKKKKTQNYLNTLEGYEDQDVKVDAEKENIVNRVKIESESSEDELHSIINDSSKLSYMENLQSYEETKDKKEVNSKEHQKELIDESDLEALEFDEGDPEKLEFDEVEDKIGTAIDDLLSDL